MKKQTSDAPSAPALPFAGLTVAVPLVNMEMTTVLIGSTFGGSIMRDGFVTETGILPSVAFDPRLPNLK